MTEKTPPKPSGGPSDAALVFALLAHALLAVALIISYGHDHHAAVLLTAGSVGAVGASLWAVKKGSRSPGAGPVATWCVALGSTLAGLLDMPGSSIEGGAARAAYLALASCAVALVASYAPELGGRAPGHPRIAACRRVMMFAVALGLGAWMLRASPAPPIDVWTVHQQGARALLHGHSVYAAGAIDTEDTHTFARRIDVYAYPPLNAILTAAAYAVTGETRWAQLVAILAGAACLWGLSRRVTRHAALPDLFAACLLFHPRGLFVLEQAWGEPLALPFLGGFALAATVGRSRLAAVLLGLLCALKQHFLLYLPALALVPQIGVPGALIALATVAATYVPFVLATPTGLWDAVVVHHLRNPFRGDSLSLTAMLADFGVALPSWLGMAASLASVGVLPWLPRRLGPLLMASSLTFLLFFVLGRQAFCNYYYLVGATWLFAGAALGEAGS